MEDIISFVQKLYGGKKVIPLHEPVFNGNEKKYLNECIETTFVSSVGKFVDQFEQRICDITEAKYAVAVVNGTCGLQIALECAGVAHDNEVITQALTFVGTANAISHVGAKPVFIDVSRSSLGMCPQSLEDFLSEHVEIKEGKAFNKNTGKKISAIMPVHVFGNPCEIDEVINIATKYNIPVVEDSAESLGSYYKDKHTGTFGKAGVFSFNGNKIVTSGGGGCIVTNDEKFAIRAKHVTTTAKQPHPYKYHHDMVGYNYRLTNLAAAVACAQLEELESFLNIKKKVYQRYEEFFNNHDCDLIKPIDKASSNHWLNSIVTKTSADKEKLLKDAVAKKIMARPIWELMSDLPMYKDCQQSDLSNSRYFADHVVSLPSSANAKV